MFKFERYSKWLSEEERRLGFDIKLIQQSASVLSHKGESETPAVVLKVTPTNRIAKVENSFLVYYVHERRTFTGEWRTIPIFNTTARQAIYRMDLQERWG